MLRAGSQTRMLGNGSLISQRRAHSCNVVQASSSEQSLQCMQDWTVLVRYGERREAVKAGPACVAVEVHPVPIPAPKRMGEFGS